MSIFRGIERGAVGVGLTLAALGASPALGETLEARITDLDGVALVGASCALPRLKQEVVSDAQGQCRFESVDAGAYDLSVRLRGYTSARVAVNVGTTALTTTVKLKESFHFSESVTVGPQSKDTFESYQAATVLGGEDLQGRLAGTLGETLNSQAGVNMRAFGPGPSRPVIRGFDGDRVLVLENGARTGDLSSQSGDHGVTLDPASATQIEVVRGPATLLYGSNALGGVVNLVSDEIATKPVKGTHGAFTLQGGTANAEAGGAGNLTFGNERWAFRVGGSGHRTVDVKTPDGAIPNSQSELKAGGASLSRTAPSGYFGASYAYDDTDYGIPFVEEGGTTLNPRRHRVDVRAEKRNLGGFIQGVKFVGGYRDYKHDEKEADGLVATSFKNRFTEGQLLLNHGSGVHSKGTFGAWATHRDYATAGEESLAPPTKQNSVSGFLYEELTYQHFGLQLGGRLDHTTFDTETTTVALAGIPTPRDRDFTEASGSLGVLGYLGRDVTVALNFARSARNPSLEELYNFGPHAGNFAFEVGSSDLAAERGMGIDLSLRWRKPRVSGELTVFGNRIDDFIFPVQTGEREDDLPVIVYAARDAQFRGLEAHVDVDLAKSFSVELGADGVRAQARDNDDPLPRIPPYRGWVALRFERKGFHLEGELRASAKQDRVYGLETPTNGFSLVNLHTSYRLIRGASIHTFTLRFDNATDTRWRNHLNFIKDQAPEMGRGLKALYSVRF